MKILACSVSVLLLAGTSISGLAQVAPSLTEIAQPEKSAEIAPPEKSAEIAPPEKSAEMAQPEKSADLPDRGFYTYIGVGGGHDPFARYTSELDISGGYDFGRTLEIEAGIPFFFLSTTDRLDANGNNNFSNRYSSFGDVFARAKVTPEFGELDYTSTATVTAPTGAKNVSAGQATWDWNNHFEMDWWHLRPIGEFVLGNVPPVTPRLVGAFTISGFATQLRGGNSFSLPKGFSFDASFYGSIPYGSSSVVAAPGRESSSSPTASNLLSDHGFTGSFSTSSARRVEFDITYSHSLTHSIDAVSVTVRYRLGHLRREYD
jgi:hypothetical protein